MRMSISFATTIYAYAYLNIKFVTALGKAFLVASLLSVITIVFIKESDEFMLEMYFLILLFNFHFFLH